MEYIADTEERLDRFLTRLLPEFSRTKLAAMANEGGVLVDGKPRKASFALSPGMLVAFESPEESEPHDLTPAEIPLSVVFENADLLVVDKPRGLATHPAASLKEPSLVNALLARGHGLSEAGGAFRPGIVHRLDKDTTGLLVVAKNDAAHVALAKQIEGKSAERRYFAVVRGVPEQEKFRIDAPIARDPKNRQKMAVASGVKRAVTHVVVIGRADAGSVLAVRLETGRTHQIRVHLRSIGHPVVGDPVYGVKETEGLPLQLHAAFLAFDDPTTGDRIECYSPPPSDFVGGAFASEEAIRRV